MDNPSLTHPTSRLVGAASSVVADPAFEGTSGVAVDPAVEGTPRRDRDPAFGDRLDSGSDCRHGDVRRSDSSFLKWPESSGTSKSAAALQSRQSVRVSSWRDSATQQAQDDLDDLDDLDGLVNASLPFAQQMLDEHGEFFPHAVALDETGDLRMIAGDPGQGEQPASASVLATLVDGLRRERASLRAVALVSDVRLADSDAVRVELEHRDGHTIAVVLPYKKKRLRRGVEYGDLNAGLGSAQVWSI